MRANARVLDKRDVAFWGPGRTRNGLFHGIMPVPSRLGRARQLARAKGRIAIRLAKLDERGIRRLVISDENMMGSMRANMRTCSLYASVGERMARYHAAFGTDVRRAVICLRRPDTYWASVFGYCLMRIGRLPAPEDMARIAAMPRSWRDVITDLACAMPGVDIVALPHEWWGHDASARLAALLEDGDVPRRGADVCRNAGPDQATLMAEIAQRAALPVERLTGADAMPEFAGEQLAALCERYEDDLFWLGAGADGLARMPEETAPETRGTHPAPGGTTERGRHHGTQGRQMA